MSNSVNPNDLTLKQLLGLYAARSAPNAGALKSSSRQDGSDKSEEVFTSSYSDASSAPLQLRSQGAEQSLNSLLIRVVAGIE